MSFARLMLNLAEIKNKSKNCKKTIVKLKAGLTVWKFLIHRKYQQSNFNLTFQSFFNKLLKVLQVRYQEICVHPLSVY
jgi:hypothetical protein